MRRIVAILLLAAALGAVPTVAAAKPNGYIGWGRPVLTRDPLPIRQEGEVRSPVQALRPRRTAGADVLFTITP